MSLLTALFPLLTAIITFVVTLVGLWYPANNERNELTEDVEALTADVSTLQGIQANLEGAVTARDETIDSLEGTIEAQQERIQELENPTAGLSGEGHESPTPDGELIGVFRETTNEPVTIPRGYSIDLDSQADNWGISSSGGLGLGLSRTTDGLRFYIPSRTIALMDGEASYEDCNSATRLREALTADHMVVGRQFCAKSRQGRWAFVTIVDVDHDREEAAVDIVVWNLPTG